jgi:hypothetical protein
MAAAVNKLDGIMGGMLAMPASAGPQTD